MIRGWNLMSDTEIEELADRTATFLSERGVELHHPGMLDILKRAGAQADGETGIVRFPRALQEAALAAAPRGLTLGRPQIPGTDPIELPLPHPEGSFYLCTGTGARGYHDPQTGTYRALTLDDVRTWGCLASVLENIDLCAFPTPTDVPPETVDVHALRALLESTTRHVWIQPHTRETVPFLLDLCAARSGGKEELEKRPLASVIACSLTPFRFKAMDIDIILRASGYGLPIHASSLPVLGGTSPITTAGTVLAAAVEVLAMVIMAQLHRPGTAVIALATALGMDMLSGRAVKASPEAMLTNAACAQFISRAYRLPVHTAALTTDSFVPDGQAMVEHSVYALMVAAAGASILGRAGELEAAKTFSPLQLIVDDENAGLLRRLSSLQLGFGLDEESLPWEDLLSVAPGGHFLEDEHTLRHCREAFRPGLFLRKSRDEWEAGGGKDLAERARERAMELIAASAAPPIPDSMVEELQRIVAEADRRLIG
ncbi:MAG: trimethylamine methyltransferase family protein [Spirochaetaceae bacterium]|nr:MAG: trimethylamine methyltransferase family protein [Spirochaetaceae bacterium]